MLHAREQRAREHPIQDEEEQLKLSYIQCWHNAAIAGASRERLVPRSCGVQEKRGDVSTEQGMRGPQFTHK
jgi:hypothetical protein